MSGDWYNNANQQPYSQPFYPHQQPHGHYPQPQPQPQPQQVIYHRQPQPGQPIDHQYIPYPQDPQDFHFPQQPQVQPQPMPTRASTRNVTLDPAYQHPQDVYSHPSSDVAGRLRTRSAVNYAGQPVPNNAPGQANDQRLRSRSSRVNYKDEDEDFMPDDGSASYGIAAGRPRRGHHQPQQSYESYGVPGGGGDDVYQPDQLSGIQPQQTTTSYRATASVNNGTIDPAVITTKEEPAEVSVTQRGRVVRKKNLIESSDDEDDANARTSRRVSRRGNEDFIAPENDEDEEVDLGDDSFGQPRLGRLTRAKATQLTNQRAPDTKSRSRKEGRSHKRSSRKRAKEGSEDDYVDEDDDDESLLDEDDLHQTSPSLPPTDDEQDEGDAGGPKTYGFRSRHGQPTNYNEIAAFEKMEQNGAATRKKSKPKKAKMNWTGKDYETAWGPLPGQSDSDSDRGQTPRKPGMGMPGTPGDGGMLAGGAGLPLDVAGTPSNLGRIGQDGSLHGSVHGSPELTRLDRSCRC